MFRLWVSDNKMSFSQTFLGRPTAPLPWTCPRQHLLGQTSIRHTTDMTVPPKPLASQLPLSCGIKAIWLALVCSIQPK